MNQRHAPGLATRGALQLAEVRFAATHGLWEARGEGAEAPAEASWRGKETVPEVLVGLQDRPDVFKLDHVRVLHSLSAQRVLDDLKRPLGVGSGQGVLEHFIPSCKLTRGHVGRPRQCRANHWTQSAEGDHHLPQLSERVAPIIIPIKHLEEPFEFHLLNGLRRRKKHNCYEVRCQHLLPSRRTRPAASWCETAPTRSVEVLVGADQQVEQVVEETQLVPMKGEQAHELQGHSVPANVGHLCL
mmetsp:Transcript_4360/g.10533  ORF Transcript_4360/g.10533 Transcript_4360/m.10533 type:complete len:243 (+) Transcript_4360:1121-1849(+)